MLAMFLQLYLERTGNLSTQVNDLRDNTFFLEIRLQTARRILFENHRRKAENYLSENSMTMGMQSL